MVSSNKRLQATSAETEVEYSDLVLRLNDILYADSNYSRLESLFQLTRFVLSRTTASRMAILEARDCQDGLPFKYQTIIDTRFPKNENLEERFFEFKKNSKILKDSIILSSLKIDKLASELKVKSSHPDWLNTFADGTGYLFPVKTSSQIRGLVYIELANQQLLPDKLEYFYQVAAKSLIPLLGKQPCLKEQNLDDWLFNSFEYPVFLLDRNSRRIKKANNALDLSSINSPLDLLSIIESTTERVSETNPLVWNRCYLPNVSGDFFIIATTFGTENKKDIYAMIVPANDKKLDMGILLNKLVREDIALEAATRQLYWDRLIQQVVTRLHSTLDQNMIIQLLVDNIGQCLNSSSCLFIKKEGTSSLVSHEYTNPGISPLGFGRTTRLPASVVDLITSGPFALSDVTSLRQGSSISSKDISSLLNSEINSFAGAPIYCNGIVFGAVIAIQLGENREWTSSDMEMIRIASRHSAIALELSMEHEKVKDQLYMANSSKIITAEVRSEANQITKPRGRSENEDIKALSERELEVLRLIASGFSNKEIAGRLFLTASTVELHASRMRKKLKMKSRTQLVKFACDHGLV